ncbi:MAG: hypothetical protein WAM66_12310 [Acidobacteriaceae bacterium]
MKLMKEHEMEPTGEFAATIRDFRTAVAHVADRETARPVAAGWLAPARQRRRTHQHRLILGWACAAALCVATLPFAIPSGPAAAHATLQPSPASAPLVQSSQVQSGRPGSGLMEQVDAEVSRSVPSSLAPLAELGNMDSTASNANDSSLDGALFAQPESLNAAH